MKSKLRATLALGLVCLLAVAAGFWASWHWWQGPDLTGEAAPAVTLVDLEGRSHTLNDPKGKLLLVNFWASWCAPCLEEIPVLVAAQTRYGPQGLQILGPAIDELEPVQAMVRRLNINYPVTADPKQAVRAADALGDKQGVLPFSVLISRDGRILKKVVGTLDQRELDELVQPHL